MPSKNQLLITDQRDRNTMIGKLRQGGMTNLRYAMGFDWKTAYCSILISPEELKKSPQQRLTEFWEAKSAQFKPKEEALKQELNRMLYGDE